MNADLWNRVAERYHAVMSKPPAERADFIATSCAGDPDLRRELESLVAHEGAADHLLENPVWQPLSSVNQARTFIAPNSTLGPFRVTSKLGEGGMGEVFRATDTRLHRDVALKVVAKEFATDTEWRSRFQREARILASLNHPHIAAIYGLEESGDVCAIAMELVEGPNLADRIAKGRIPIPEALAIARQICEALEHAHEQGIIHRDLKPSNIKVRSDGAVKVLDFGLAKPASSKDAPASHATRSGLIIGTPAYMPPEQAAGKHVDRRADIWAFGIVLFEMLNGASPYERDTAPLTLAAVARDEPPWSDLPSETPVALVKLLRRCLDKDPKHRLRDIGEARIALEGPLDEPAPAALRASSRAGWIPAAILAAALAAIALYQSTRPASFERYRFTPMEVIWASPSSAKWSPDGKALAYTALISRVPQLFLRYLSSPNPVQLTPGPDAITLLGWSPDNKRIFVDSKNPSGSTPPEALFSVPVVGGDPEFMTPRYRGPAAISPDGNIEARLNYQPEKEKWALYTASPVGSLLKKYSPAVEFDDFANAPSLFLAPDGRRIYLCIDPPDGRQLWSYPYPSGSGRTAEDPEGLPPSS